MRGFWVYILECADKSYYTGHTDNLEKRLYEHEQNLFKCYTSKRLPVRLVYSCEFETREDALARERQIKGWSRRKKQALIVGDWSSLVNYSRGRTNRPSALRQAQGERKKPYSRSKGEHTMGLFSKRKDRKLEAMKFLTTTIITCALHSTKSISDEWTSVTNQDSMSIYMNYGVKLEMLCFYLHMMDEYALSIGGPEARAALQDAVVIPTIQAMIDMSFNTSNANKGFDSQKWKDKMVSEALEEYNEAGVDYFSCKSFGTEGTGGIFRDDTVIGNLVKRIENIAGQGLNLNLRMLVLASMTNSLVKSKLKKQVEKACSIL